MDKYDKRGFLSGDPLLFFSGDSFFFFFFLSSLFVGGLVHRQISTSQSSLCVMTFVIPYRPPSLYHVQRGYKRRRPARYGINAGVGSCGVLFWLLPPVVFFLTIRVGTCGVISRQRGAIIRLCARRICACRIIVLPLHRI